MKHVLSVLMLALCLAFVQASVHAQEGLETVRFITTKGEQTFQVEAMRTEAKRASGLMYRRYMPEDRGMLFEFETERPIMMWMKNTYLPLDMIFINKAGKVVSIVADTEPMSEKTIPSGGPIQAVIELNAGVARKIGLAVGDQVKHPFFKQ